MHQHAVNEIGVEHLAVMVDGGEDVLRMGSSEDQSAPPAILKDQHGLTHV